MLATLVIGLREGLEAALIVGIIAAFLKRNGKSLAPMWIGVTLAIALSIAVGVTLEVVEQALPQAQQEGMEAIIGSVAIFFVTGMIVWMNTHARGMRRELERSAAEAMSEGTAWALAAMAFLAVLKEGFETSVFLLATFQASTSEGAAAAGAVVGVIIAVGIGIGLYTGGVRLDLARFFRVTSAFLILVAAGLVITALRTAHEAGWLNAAQQTTVNLSWLAPNGSVQAALITGVLGIPADPRLIEVIGWFCYLVPVALFVYWPAAYRPRGRTIPRVHAGIAAALAAAALVLLIAVPAPGVSLPAHSAIVGATGGASTGTIAIQRSGDSLTLRTTTSAETSSETLSDPRSVTTDGVAATEYTRRAPGDVSGASRRLTLDDLLQIGGGRLPVGFAAGQNPGPFDAAWSSVRTTSVTVAGGGILAASSSTTTLVTLTGGGLTSSRLLTVAPGTRIQGAPAALNGVWRLAPAAAREAATAVTAAGSAANDRILGKYAAPLVLVLAAMVLAARALVMRRRVVRAEASAEPVGPVGPAPAADSAVASAEPADQPAEPPAVLSQPTPAPPARSTTYAAR